jgi:hypothetical protein
MPIMSELVHHPVGNYSFLPGISPYSCGVVADPGYEVVHVTLDEPLDWPEGFERVDRYLADARLTRAALCAMELRSPAPFSMRGFIEFNERYCAVLKEWGVYVDGVNPIARTNVCPVALKATEPMLAAFACIRPNAKLQRRTFIVAGAGELVDGTLDSQGIHRR